MGGSGGYRRLPGGSDDFLWHTNTQTHHHNIYITILIMFLNILNILTILILTLEAANSTVSLYNALRLSRSEAPGNVIIRNIIGTAIFLYCCNGTAIFLYCCIGTVICTVFCHLYVTLVTQLVLWRGWLEHWQIAWVRSSQNSTPASDQLVRWWLPHLMSNEDNQYTTFNCCSGWWWFLWYDGDENYYHKNSEDD